MTTNIARGPVTQADIDRLTSYSQLAQRELTPFLKTACVRIMRRTTEAEDFRPEATGSLFAIRGIHFLVTAAHVFDGEPDLWIENDVTKKIMTLVGPRWRNDAIDIAFVALNDDLVAHLAGMRFFTMQEVRLDAPAQSILAITGYPQEKNVGTKYALGYFSTPQPHEVGVSDPQRELLLGYDLSFSAGEDGTPVGLPDSLKGMSGCPVWWFDPMKPMSTATMRLVGVQTGTVPVEGMPNLKLVKATRWAGVLTSLVQAYPDLERVLRLHGLRTE